MLCSHCGAEILPDYKYCPSCGIKLEPSTTIIPPEPVHQQTVKKKMPIWYKIAAFLAVLALVGVTAGILFTEGLVDVIDNQLEALRKQDITKAYSYTSKDFQATTTLDQFRNFVEAYPVFLNNQSAHFSQRSIENNIGTLKGNLTSLDHSNTPIEYKLIKEEGKWKILTIRLLKPRKIQNAKQADHAEDLIEIAKMQLKDIQDQKISEAYQNYSSKEFKDATSEEAFKEFLNRYPILKYHHVVSFHNPVIRSGIGTLSVILQSDQIAAYVKYYFIYEDQNWKIWTMRILSPSEGLEERKKELGESKKADGTHPMSFGSILLGDAVDEQGQIKNPQKVFKSDLKDLYIDIQIQNGRKDNLIYLNVKHLESGSSVPAKAAIEENGDSMLMSVFSSPAAGWPTGHYQLSVTTSSGLESLVNFEIE